MEDTFSVKSATRAGAVAKVRREMAPDRIEVVEVQDWGRSANSRMWAVTFRVVEDTFGRECYAALAVEGWDTEDKLAAEADALYVREARAYAEREGLVFPPVAVGRDFAGQIIAAAFGL